MENIPERAKGNEDSGPDNSGKSSSIHNPSSDCDLGLKLGRVDRWVVLDFSKLFLGNLRVDVVNYSYFLMVL